MTFHLEDANSYSCVALIGRSNNDSFVPCYLKVSLELKYKSVYKHRQQQTEIHSKPRYV